jgi:hypothetical protein
MAVIVTIPSLETVIEGLLLKNDSPVCQLKITLATGLPDKTIVPIIQSKRLPGSATIVASGNFLSSVTTTSSLPDEQLLVVLITSKKYVPGVVTDIDVPFPT